MHFYLEKLEDVYNREKFSYGGLDSLKVKSMRERYGKNVLTKKKKDGLFRRIFNALREPMVLILVFAFLITLAVNVGNLIGGGEVDPFECIGIFTSICISVGLTVIMERKSEKAFEALKSFTDNLSVYCLRDGEKRIVGTDDVCVGDVVFYETGEKVVADCLLIESVGLEVDESMLTGESVGVSKTAFAGGRFRDENILNSGTYVKGGNAKALVLAVGDSARIGSIASGLSEENDISAPLAAKLTSLSKKISVFGAVASVIVFCLTVCRMFVAGNFSFVGLKDAFLSAIVLIVAAVPEGLPTTVAISLALSVVRLAKSNAVIKKLVAAETVGCVSVICSDKTGTLTFGVMEVDCFVSGGAKISPKSAKFNCFYENIAYNSTAAFVNDGNKSFIAGNSTERALLNYVFKDNREQLEKMRNAATIESRVPFSSERKYMSTSIYLNGSKTTYYKGGIEVICDICGFDDATRRRIISGAEAYENAAERVLAFAREIDGTFLFDGFCAVTDKVRPEVAMSVRKCRQAGIDVKILTGDNRETAVAVAKKLGIAVSEENCLTGKEISEMTDAELGAALGEISVVARCLPETKLRIVSVLKKNGEVVAVTGDGVNDAPAVKNADIGIAMGDGSEITKEASDIILLDNSFSVIVKAVSFGRNIYKNFQSFLFFQLTVNFSAVGMILAFLIMGFAPPFSALQLLWINVIMDGPLALSLGLEKRSDEFLEAKPVKRTDEIVPKRTFFRIILHSLYSVVILVMQKKYNFLGVEVGQSGTAVFCLFVLIQMFNAINARELSRKSILGGIGKNKLFGILLILTVVFQVVMTQFCVNLFDTTALSLSVWLKIFLVSCSVIVLSEAYKTVYRMLSRKKTPKISKRRKFA